MRTLRFLPILAAVLTASACGDSSPSEPVDEGPTTLTVDAHDGWTYVAFSGSDAAVINVTDSGASTDWHMALFGTATMLNGGGAGPGEVEGYCYCQNDGASEDEIVGMTADGELADFEAVGAADIPTDEESWVSDALAPAIDGWYSYDFQTHTVSAAPEQSFYVRTASGDAVAKLHVSEIANATQDHAGEVTLEFAVQPPGASGFDPLRVLTVDLSTGSAYVDLESASASSSEEPGWDLVLSGYEIRVNGGVSGEGQAGAGATETPFDQIDDASGLPDGALSGDQFGGVFEAHSWYRYNLEGNHRIWPTFDVYLVRTEDAVYKVQLVDYYGPTGDTRQITFRYERLGE